VEVCVQIRMIEERMLIAAAYDSETLCCLVPLSELQKIGWWLGGRHVTCRFAKIRA